MFSDKVLLIDKFGRYRPIFFNQNSGKVIYRFKTDPKNIKHPGIYLGKDNKGDDWLIHNHYQYGKPVLVPLNSFALNQTLFANPEACTNSWNQVIEKGLVHVIKGKPYNLLNNNCQTTVNDACHNQPLSEDVSKFIGGIALGSIVIGFGLALSQSNN